MTDRLDAAVANKGSSKPSGFKGWPCISDTLTPSKAAPLCSGEASALKDFRGELPCPARYTYGQGAGVFILLDNSPKTALVGNRVEQVFAEKGVRTLLLFFFSYSTIDQTFV